MQWDINVPVALRWRLTDSDGSVLGDVLFPAADIVPATLVYTADAGWSRSPQTPFDAPTVVRTFGGLDCSTGAQILQQDLQGKNLAATMYPGQGVNGCQISLSANENPAQGTFLWRFGVLLAADDAAHQLLPNLPIASRVEITAVQG
jgi:hypothetical protein